MFQIGEKIRAIGPVQRRWMVLVAVFVVWAAVLFEQMSRLRLFIATANSWLWFITLSSLFSMSPGLIAILLMFTPKTKTRAGSILKTIAVAVLIIAPLFRGEFMWIVIALMPLYVVGVFVLSMIEARQKKREAATTDAGEHSGKINSAQWSMVAITVAFTTGALLYRVLMHEGLAHSAAMFVGIPAVLAILLALTPKAKSLTGGIVKGITLALLIIAPLVGEGYLCILMASPLFYVIGIVVGVVVDELRLKRKTTLSCVALVLLPMSMEGVIPALSFNRNQTVEIRSVVNAAANVVERNLASSPDLSTALPAALNIGFPRPLEAWGVGLEIGAMRTIHFAGAEGDPPGDLIMQVTERRPGFVRFQTVSDHSKLTQWIDWDASEVEWKELDPSHTRVTWRIQFKRELDPAWYFAPLERVAVDQAVRYLIQANAAPHGPDRSR